MVSRSPMDTRALIACEHCKKQWDVSRLAPGSKLDCRCGTEIRVRARKPRSPRCLRCSSCGANLREAEQECGYCGAEVTLEERRLDSICPGCYARMGSEARFCMECGLSIQPCAVSASAMGLDCPVCKTELNSRMMAGVSFAECARCAGMWLEPGCFDQVCGHARDARKGVPAPQAPPQVEPVGEAFAYRSCPECDDMMVRRNFGQRSGVIIDVCRGHGVWVDHRELEEIVRWIRAGGEESSALRPIEGGSVVERVRAARPARREPQGFLGLLRAVGEDLRDFLERAV